ncbi:MAG: hypothetical protein LBJ39_03355, partial [Tannerellaceae bacterium]|jgi:hypothetical protein|nr:hypothetical protein [Tannerellaceae bacterium]
MHFIAVVFGNEIFVALGGSSVCYVYTSIDGITWTDRGRTGAGVYDVKFIDARFVLLSTQSIAYSDDGITWTVVDEQARSFDIYGDGIYINLRTYVNGSGSTSTHIAASKDGNLIEWTNVYELGAVAYEGIWDGSQFVVPAGSLLVSGDALKLPDIENAWIKALE